MQIYQVIVFASLFILIINYLLNLRCFRLPTDEAVPRSTPLISVLIPARNEEKRILPCLESLSAGDYRNLEILVLDDQSSDHTSEVVRLAAHQDSRIRLLAGADLPGGWTGKSWACQQLAGQSRGDFLLFVDADTRFSGAAIAHALGVSEKTGADLLSLWPHLEAKSWSERLVIPFVHLFILLYLPHWMEGRSAALGAANGQFLLFRRTAYEKLGGHHAVRGHLVEDVALGRKMKAAGFRVMNLDATNPGKRTPLVRCRMYENFPDLWNGFTKNLYPAFDGRFFAFVFFQLFQLSVFFAPFVLLLWFPRDMFLWFMIMMILCLRLAVAGRFRQSRLGALLHPLGQFLVLAIAANSWFQTIRRRLPWRGRHYAHHPC
ncbi:MAG: glycosyltransferase [Verrucomicrobia bacterium]|nr:glycosyltransferase [Verrucomicrobiota bacterium]